jgi:hypothetical protein
MKGYVKAAQKLKRLFINIFSNANICGLDLLFVNSNIEKFALIKAALTVGMLPCYVTGLYFPLVAQKHHLRLCCTVWTQRLLRYSLFDLVHYAARWNIPTSPS